MSTARTRVYSVAPEPRRIPPYKTSHPFVFSSTHSTHLHPPHLDHLLSLLGFYSQNQNLVEMCHNIIDGRFYTTCRHFEPVSTRLQDCNKPDCLFSRRHEHPVGCKSHQCRRMMSLPVHNPIRMFESICGDCVIRTKSSC